tara:strand:+ start:142 stop:339 length:198 start_codon:yes stop_codon:yes gene_type:complete
MPTSIVLRLNVQRNPFLRSPVASDACIARNKPSNVSINPQNARDLFTHEAVREEHGHALLHAETL